ncbi:MAG: VirB4 family type IV secretion system protein [Christensenellales bacterium]|jgi:hypothetical protein|nr:DUF87 domain-containing protein [Clostridiales bacterium]
MRIKGPQDVNVKTYIFKSFTFKDIVALVLIGLMFGLMVVLDIPGKAIIITILAPIALLSIVKFRDVRGYEYLIQMLEFVLTKKDYTYLEYIRECNISKIEKTHVILGGSILKVAKCFPKTTMYLNESERNILEGKISAFLASTDGVEIRIIKVKEQIAYEDRAKEEIERAKNLRDKANSKTLINVVQSRLNVLNEIGKKALKKDSFYIAFIGQENMVEESVLSFEKTFKNIELLEDKELLNFMKSYLFLNVENGLSMPEFGDNNKHRKKSDKGKYNVQIEPFSVRIEDAYISHICINKYPRYINNGYLNSILNIDADIVELRLNKEETYKAIKQMDKAALEISTRQKTTRSKEIEEEVQDDSVSDLIYKVGQENQSFYTLKVLIRTKDNIDKIEQKDRGKRRIFGRNLVNAKKVEYALKSLNIGVSKMQFAQQDGMRIFASDYGYKKSSFVDYGIKSQTTTNEVIAKGLSFFKGEINDENGLLIGDNPLPIYLNMFKRNSEYLNSNCMVIGNSGSGKSFAVKTLIANMATENIKIYVLDPEGEYEKLANSLDGQNISVGSEDGLCLNPFYIPKGGNLRLHLQFLDEFFKMSCSLSPLESEILNNQISLIYNRRKITQEALNEGKIVEFPNFEKLVDSLRHAQKAQEEKGNLLEKECLENLRIRFRKFQGVGREASLYSDTFTFDDSKDLTCFNFSKLFQSKNINLVNTQMLLTLKLVEGLIFENFKNGYKTLVVVDEAHLFFSEENLEALDFMYQLAKRIRKYNGMQIVVTQSIKDFTASKALQKKTQAIINASQYSLIFPLHSADIKELKTIYSAGLSLSDFECETITKNLRGSAFLISSARSRDNIKIFATPYVRSLFE